MEVALSLSSGYPGMISPTYIDDIVIKTRVKATLLEDIAETFAALKEYQIKLKLTKCMFGVPAGQLLGYLVSARGIEANPEKIQALIAMEEPTDLRGVQRLAGRVAALSRFISKLGERALPFYQLLKKFDKFEWTPEAREAFLKLKHMLSTKPVLVAPHEREPLYLYIAATRQAAGSSGSFLTNKRPSSALAHLSARSKSLTMVVMLSWMPSFSSIRTSVTPAWKAKMTCASVALGILLRTWLKRWMYLRRVSPGFWRTAEKSLYVTPRSYVPFKFATKHRQSSYQVLMDSAMRFVSH